jgi:valyl-tRNA synthetase
VAVKSLAEPAIEAVENGAIQFVPKNWENTYFAWMRDIQDWCISRQLWWGHRIPAWYDSDNNIYVGHDEADVRQKYQLAAELELHQDEDVLDTWFSSALWTFSTLGWPDDMETFRTYHPTDVLVTGFDIIFFWVARMIMMTLKFTGQVPFHKFYIHGLIRDDHGQKMSKSKGNVLDPIDLIDGIALDALVAKRTSDMMQPELAGKIEQMTRESFPDGIPGYGTDALRFTFYSLATTGRDIIFDLGRIEGYRNFCNKIWNAARYALMNSEEKALDLEALKKGRLTVADRWILSRLQQAVTEVHNGMANYRFDLVAQAIHSFFWDEYCDWYLELSKPVLWDEESNPEQAAATRYVLLVTLEQSLRLLHPFMPFISEEVWQRVAPLLDIAGPTIMLQPYPLEDSTMKDSAAEAEVDWLKGVILAIRNIRGEMDIPPGKVIPVLFRNGNENDRQLLEGNRQYLTRLAKLESVQWLEADAELPPAATQLHGELEILVPMAGLIDTEAEIARLNKEIAKLQGVLEGITKKLANEKFVANAPAEVVEKERDKQAGLQASLAALQGKLETLQQLAD